jgi:hypothetical protein
MRFRLIEDHRVVWPVRVMCEALSVSRSGYYAWRSRPVYTLECEEAAAAHNGRSTFLYRSIRPCASRIWASNPFMRCLHQRWAEWSRSHRLLQRGGIDPQFSQTLAGSGKNRIRRSSSPLLTSAPRPPAKRATDRMRAFPSSIGTPSAISCRWRSSTRHRPNRMTAARSLLIHLRFMLDGFD